MKTATNEPQEDNPSLVMQMIVLAYGMDVETAPEQEERQ